MGVAKILVAQEYTYEYCMWKSLTANDRTWVRFKAHFQEAYLDREELKQTAGAAGYGTANYVKYGKIEDAFMNFASATAARGAYFTNITTMNGNLSTQLRYKEGHIRAL